MVDADRALRTDALFEAPKTEQALKAARTCIGRCRPPAVPIPVRRLEAGAPGAAASHVTAPRHRKKTP